MKFFREEFQICNTNFAILLIHSTLFHSHNIQVLLMSEQIILTAYSPTDHSLFPLPTANNRVVGDGTYATQAV
ncbi:6850_t:CDS:2 [Funneliformis mosseae]|uniref:6850_t:CDS:1 n=1 Tax=Funneliformis mosseae TaxID=27381 RepID=A0A9N8WKU3_FUNMO|nr:6850_t:CDS:2 [Funneliformis mosseae]